jgi:hypothetical protein
MAKLGKKYLDETGLGGLVDKIKTRYVRTDGDNKGDNTTFSNVELTDYTLSQDIADKDKSPVIIGVKSADNSENIVKQSTVTIGGEELSYKTITVDGKEVKEYSKNILVTERAVADLFEDLSNKIAAEGAVMDFKGTTSVAITNGSDVKPKDIYGDPDILGDDYKGPENGDVVVYNNEEFIWNDGSWHEIGQVFNSEAIKSISDLTKSDTDKKYAFTANKVYEGGKLVEGVIQLKLVITETNVDKNWEDYKADTNYGHIHLSQDDSGLKAEYGAEVVVVAHTITGKEIDDLFN